ncbi:hypothetical protein Droror1_Dr00000589 [Drosera rotundifolia]
MRTQRKPKEEIPKSMMWKHTNHAILDPDEKFQGFGTQIQHPVPTPSSHNKRLLIPLDACKHFTGLVQKKLAQRSIEKIQIEGKRKPNFDCCSGGGWLLVVGDDNSCPLIKRDPRLRLGCARVVGGQDRSSTTRGGGGLTARGGRSSVVMEFMVKMMVVGRDVEEKEKKSVGEDRGEKRGAAVGN